VYFVNIGCPLCRIASIPELGYLDEFVFRFNRRSVSFVGKKFMRIAEQAMLTDPLPYRMIIVGAAAQKM